MNKLTETLIDKCVQQLMDKSRHELMLADEIYKSDNQDRKELELRYESLNLSKEQRMITNDYIACSQTMYHRYADLSYIAGINDAIKMLSSLGLITLSKPNTNTKNL